jgi:hypothetical protein
MGRDAKENAAPLAAEECPFIRSQPNWSKCPYLRGLFGTKSADSVLHPKTTDTVETEVVGPKVVHPGMELHMSLDAETVEEKTEDFAL